MRQLVTVLVWLMVVLGLPVTMFVVLVSHIAGNPVHDEDIVDVAHLCGLFTVFLLALVGSYLLLCYLMAAQWGWLTQLFS